MNNHEAFDSDLCHHHIDSLQIYKSPTPTKWIQMGIHHHCRTDCLLHLQPAGGIFLCSMGKSEETLCQNM